jgi:hypothetical protein
MIVPIHSHRAIFRCRFSLIRKLNKECVQSTCGIYRSTPYKKITRSINGCQWLKMLPNPRSEHSVDCGNVNGCVYEDDDKQVTDQEYYNDHKKYMTQILSCLAIQKWENIKTQLCEIHKNPHKPRYNVVSPCNEHSASVPVNWKFRTDRKCASLHVGLYQQDWL